MRRITGRVLRWYGVHARDLPWRRPEATPWSIVVSEFMLQQTPVSRVLEPWQRWTERWPSPTALATAPAGEAVRAWGRLGYPRRALRLHAAAGVMVQRHGGEVPRELDALRALPGVGDYTAAAVASFAFGQRHAVLDTNVRRVLGRVARGEAQPGAALTAAERTLAVAFLPARPQRAARWAVAAMELGALVCTARAPRCEVCPVRSTCRWRAAGRPPRSDPPRQGQPYAGTDRQCRGSLLARLRATEGELADTDLAAAWSDVPQRSRCLASLVDDGLVERRPYERYALPA
ncbi:MAG: A/G-specific adenine glycosylase [Actinomycetes bacterium]